MGGCSWSDQIYTIIKEEEEEEEEEEYFAQTTRSIARELIPFVELSASEG